MELVREASMEIKKLKDRNLVIIRCDCGKLHHCPVTQFRVVCLCGRMETLQEIRERENQKE